ncbi:hypothetical protein AB0B12_04545 [Streptomyces sp. NPDC044780]|uniref:hypothetical protein n=1 Tax=unclassified Streptomyces TaxID=2593676 RepID=UPI0033ED8B65
MAGGRSSRRRRLVRISSAPEWSNSAKTTSAYRHPVRATSGSPPGLYWVLTIAGGGAYAVATALERRRLTIR